MLLLCYLSVWWKPTAESCWIRLFPDRCFLLVFPNRVAAVVMWRVEKCFKGWKLKCFNALNDTKHLASVWLGWSVIIHGTFCNFSRVVDSWMDSWESYFLKCFRIFNFVWFNFVFKKNLKPFLHPTDKLAEAKICTQILIFYEITACPRDKLGETVPQNSSLQVKPIFPQSSRFTTVENCYTKSSPPNCSVLVRKSPSLQGSCVRFLFGRLLPDGTFGTHRRAATNHPRLRWLYGK